MDKGLSRAIRAVLVERVNNRRNKEGWSAGNIRCKQRSEKKMNEEIYF